MLSRRTFAGAALLGAALGLAAAVGASVTAAEQPKTVAVTAIVEHPALDAARKGIKDELAAEGYLEGRDLKLEFESAQGSPATAAQIAQKFVGEKPDVIVPISTPSAQAVVGATKSIPVVFTAVTDPVGAKLVPNLEHPGGNVTGMSDLSPIRLHLDLIKEIMPKATHLGVIYNPGEANSMTLLNLLQKEAPGHGLSLVGAPAPRSADVLAAAQSLVGDVDAIYVPTDNTVVTALEAIVKIGTDNQLPVFAGDTDSVPRGAIAALGFNYYDLGRQTGKIVARVLKGEKPGDLPVESIKTTQLFVNPGAAKAMGITLPDSVIKRAKVVVG
ncbi:MAG TPA: ABC transporter substrate-binding protein [Geminicoccaceae bacterium]|jgi:putative ABC transport system substrate-binding protein|nr:ABC transporter substrate-binding protein [Geminicoccaceae bacterium]